ncbi:MAG: TrkH family potassium uptake protein [Bacteroidales bacterium]|jgi:trk system potassium uptake protein TrkH|nr:TrkH family potassium uptake protein [Bacteroidales bacterium]MDD2263737.1 potassium transporter TrkG [Bacteroidales bacterium]MDD2831045.1 potassium transporter TrkG [Bacteroidales bacterium]MDD3208147.1 potassium transporter TrkG [Bacteroidales bacterium]MDD3696811.1 potassium transporter TrkG [Bacteroidales bacterium]
MRIQVIARNMGLVLLVNALFMAIAVLVSALYGFDTGFSPLLLSAIITATIGSFPYIFVKKASDVATREGYMIVVISWVLSCLFGMLPYLLWGGEFTLINAWYESVSGYTTTGGTILTNVEAIPHSLLFWRASTHWIGGMGVVIFMLLILPEVSSIRLKLSRIEISALSQESYRFRTKETVRVIAYVYFGLTLLETICLLMAGMSLFDAVCHSFATIATGGFSTRNINIAAYDSKVIEFIIIIFMCLSALHFGMIFMLVVKRSTILFKSPVTRYFISSILLGGLFVSLSLKFTGTYETFTESFRHGFFQTISLATSTGFATADSSIWPGFVIILLIFFTLQCGCSGSTSGGIKADRILISIFSFKAEITKRLHPRSVVPVRIGGHALDSDMVFGVNLYIVLYLFCVLISSLFLTLTGIDIMDAVSASAAHIGNVGPGFGSVGSLSNYNAFNGFSKFILSIMMIMGRIELFGFFILFSSRK